MRLPKFKIKLVLMSLITLLLVPSIVFGATRGYDYLAVNGLKIEAERLADKGMYGAALSKLEETEGKWAFEKTRAAINSETKEYRSLAESSNNYEQGKMSFDEKDYEGAIEYFRKVLKSDVNYNSAQSWIVLAEKKLAGDEGKDQGSAVSVNTQSSDISKDFNQIISSPAVNANDNPKLEIIYGLFSKIGDLNGQLGVQQVLLEDALKNSINCEEKYGRQYLPSGEYNPNFVMTPSTQTQLIQSCQSSGANSILQQSNSIKRQIRDFNRQILDVMATCQTNECAKYYQEVVGAFEAKGYVVR